MLNRESRDWERFIISNVPTYASRKIATCPVHDWHSVSVGGVKLFQNSELKHVVIIKSKTAESTPETADEPFLWLVHGLFIAIISNGLNSLLCYPELLWSRQKGFNSLSWSVLIDATFGIQCFISCSPCIAAGEKSWMRHFADLWANVEEEMSKLR
jgi:hypothetical protein